MGGSPARCGSTGGRRNNRAKQVASRRGSAAAAAGALALLVLLLVERATPSGLRHRWLTGQPLAFSGAPLERRHALGHTAAGLLLSTAAAQTAAAKDINYPPGYVPAEMVGKEVGETITTPNGLIFEVVELGSTATGKLEGPPRSQSTCVLRWTARIDGFDGKIFDSSYFRGQKKPMKTDKLEVRLNVDPSLPPGVFEAVKLMKVGGKGRATLPPKLGYSEGKVAVDVEDNDGEVKKIPAQSTLYYDIELVRIIKP